jgi:rhodanese-related sulfurtransferase
MPWDGVKLWIANVDQEGSHGSDILQCLGGESHDRSVWCPKTRPAGDEARRVIPLHLAQGLESDRFSLNMKTIVGVFVVAAVATVGDSIWYTYGVRHTILAGLVHGALLLTAVGAVLGAASGRVLKGLPIGALAGIGAAASYYVLVAVMDRRTYGSAIPAAWVIMWLILAALEGRWLRAPKRRTWAALAGRGLAAAVIGGLAFYLVMNILWGRPPAGGRNYVVQFFAWAFAWAPGLFILSRGGAPEATSASSQMTSATTPLVPAPVVDTDKPITVVDILERIDRGETLRILDVRSEGEFAAGHVPGAVNIPFTKLFSRMDDVPGKAGDELILYCGHGLRAYIAATALRHGGRKRIVYLRGHWAAWQDAGLRVER